MTDTEPWSYDGWNFAVFWIDESRPYGMQAQRASARNLPAEEAEAERARLQAEKPEIRYHVWFERTLPSDEGIAVEQWQAGLAAPQPQQVYVGSAMPEPTKEN